MRRHDARPQAPCQTRRHDCHRRLGGIKKTHGGASLSELETPFIIAGKHVKRGGEFEESMMQYDTAATIAYIFGLKQPQVWTGRPMTQVFK